MQLSFCFTAGINRARILTGLPEQLFAVLYPFCICIESVYRIIQSFKIVKFNVFSLLSSLIYSRAVCPCSKAKTFDEVLPKLYEPAKFSLNQLYAGLEYLGSEYEKVIEIYNLSLIHI